MKFLFTFLLTACVSFAFSQSTYNAYRTELYTKNTSTKKWELATENKNTNITVVSEKDHITIQAQSPTMYKLYPGDTKDINLEKFVGFRYHAKELKKDESCDIEMLKHIATGLIVVNVIYEDVMLRYFIETK
jgi:hypothetical protein